MQLRRRSMKVAAVALAIAAFGTSAGEAFAGTGASGAASATCGLTGREILASAPFIQAEWVSVPRGIAIIGGGSVETGYNVQTVGFRVWLQRWNGAQWVYTDQTGEGYYDRTALFTTTVVGQTNLETYWWATDFGRWKAPGDMTFDIRDGGYYWLVNEIFWFPNQLASGGSTVLVSAEYFTYEYFGVAKSWCEFR